MSMCRGLGLLLAGAFLVGPAVMAKVYVRWTHSAVPPAKTLGVNDLVIPWGATALTMVDAAKKQGYHVYLEVGLQEADTAAKAGGKAGIAGIVLQGSAAQQTQLAESADKMRGKFPKLKILVMNAHGKQPEMRGWLVFSQNGILQVSSPSSQPWLDENLAMVRYERVFEARQTPLYSFSWDITDPLVKENGPSATDYSLAIAEAGAFHGDLLLELYERQQKGLAGKEKQTLEDWEQVKRTIAFYEGRRDGDKEAATVAVLTDDYDTSYEETNLLSRHNVLFRVLNSAETKATDLAEFDVVIAFAALTKDLTEALQGFAEQGGVVVAVNLPGKYPWASGAGTKTGEHSTSYTVGKGRVIELGEPVSDPETFAQDVRRLTVKQHVPMSLWNSLTTLVVEYPGGKKGGTMVELVNYSEEPTQVQVQVRGIFASARYENPQQGCCEKLKAEHVDGFTQFVVPNLLTGGRVHLEGGVPSAQ
jgi:hypothetical protein